MGNRETGKPMIWGGPPSSKIREPRVMNVEAFWELLGRQGTYSRPHRIILVGILRGGLLLSMVISYTWQWSLLVMKTYETPKLLAA